MNDLHGQTAIVTGSSSGIGRAIALELAAGGAQLLVHANASHDAAEEVATLIRGQGRAAEVILCDLAAPDSHPSFVERAWQWQGGIDIWVNNAGADVLTGAAAKQSFEEKLEHLWRVDVQATLSLSRMAGRRMKQRGRGVILNMGWDQAEWGMGGDSGEMFAAVKGAIMAFSRSLAQSLAPQVRVNCLAPGWIQTSWGKNASASWQERATRESLRGRWGTPEDVAQIARFLVSPAADFLNGQIIPINGGFHFSAFASLPDTKRAQE